MAHEHRVRIYYEDTDLSGVVYHANYLKYFERAREHLLGPDELVRMFHEDGIGFVVYKVELHFRAGARLGDELVIRTTMREGSPFRGVFEQAAWRDGDEQPLVTGVIQVACVDGDGKLVRMPEAILARIRAGT